MRALKINEMLQFKQGGDPYDSLNIGLSRFTKNAQVYYYNNKSISYNVTNKTTHTNKIKYGIIFPEISLKADLIFAKNIDGKTFIIDDWQNAVGGGLIWIGEKPDEELQNNLHNWFFSNVDELMSNAIQIEREEYIKKILMYES